MKRGEWTICERSGRWTAAVRLAIQRANWPAADVPRLLEVRRLTELEKRLDTQANEVALVEIDRANLAEMLSWLATASRSRPGTRWAALIDIEDISPDAREQLADVLREAGANEVADTPRQVQRVLTLGRPTATQSTLPNSRPADLSQMAWAWESLPWQDE
jgi:hypothetical protein